MAISSCLGGTCNPGGYFIFMSCNIRNINESSDTSPSQQYSDMCRIDIISSSVYIIADLNKFLQDIDTTVCHMILDKCSANCLVINDYAVTTNR